MTKENGETSNIFDEFDPAAPVTRGELIQILEETQEMLTEMKNVINVHADVLGCHRYVLEKFVPLPLFQAAVKQYYEARSKEIDMMDHEPETDAAKLN
jgi:hypothetical protein